MQAKNITNNTRTGAQKHFCGVQHHETELDEKDVKFLETLWCEIGTISTDSGLDLIDSDAAAIDEVTFHLDQVGDPKPYKFSMPKIPINNPMTLKCTCTAGLLCSPCATLCSRATNLVKRSRLSHKRANLHVHTMDPRIPQVPSKQQFKRGRAEILARWKDKRAKRARRGATSAQNCSPEYSSRASVARQRKRVGGRFVKEAKMVTAKYRYKDGKAIVCI